MLARSRLALAGALLTLLASALPASAAGETPYLNQSAIQMVERMAAQIVASDLQRFYGIDPAATCVQTAERSFCLAPDTPPEVVEELLRKLPTWIEPEGDRYNRVDRWSLTASGFSGILGDPVILTYSFLPDGTYIPSEDENSSLFARLNAQFGGNTEAWKQIFRDCFARWAFFVGLHYVEEVDDGAAFPDTWGVLGVRGDIRIGMANIDGPSNVLAYNYYPASGGDMVLDWSENWGDAGTDYRFFRNVVMHEHGHGHGLGHIEASNRQLMEPYYDPVIYGPQDDDIRGGMRNYGFYLEKNSTAADATLWGTLPEGPLQQENVSVTASSDSDYFKFTIASGMLLDVVMTPVGSFYVVDGVQVWTNQIMDLGFELRASDGVTVLTTANAGGLGVVETITDFELTAGDYYLRVRRYSGNDVQRYRLNIDLTQISTAVGEAAVPARGLGLSVFPTPFNPKTTARFYVREAGSVSLEIFNVQGRRIQGFRQEAAGNAWVQVSWNGQDETGSPAPSGLYFLRATSGGESETVRALLLK
ncbi:matrixin family metalloprotease [bacterium]|nr:matrixin family metalloprotease [bacterium]